MMPIWTWNYAEEQSKNWFLNYLQLKESSDFPDDSRCRSLLEFWTGWSVVPFGSLSLEVILLPDDEKHYLPRSSACTATLRLPTVPSSQGNFFKVGFPNP